MKRFNHLEATGFSYIAHLTQAMRYFITVQRASLCLFLHAFWPDLYEDTASTILIRLTKEFQKSK